MPHFTTYGGSHFSAGPDVYHPEFQPEGDDFLKLGDIKGEFASKHDPLTGLDTGSGNDHIVHHIGTTAGLGGTTFFSGYSEAVGLDGHMVCPEPPFLMNVGGASGPGGTTFMTGYTNGTSYEGMDSTTEVIDVMNNFTNFAMPVGDFI